jgi:hypothetical protein
MGVPVAIGMFSYKPSSYWGSPIYEHPHMFLVVDHCFGNPQLGLWPPLATAITLGLEVGRGNVIPKRRHMLQMALDDPRHYRVKENPKSIVYTSEVPTLSRSNYVLTFKRGP